MIAELPVHPAAELFPMLSEDELHQLADDIRAHGLHEAIVLFEGKVLDGRNRLLGCHRAGVEPKFVEWSGSGDPVEWVLTVNFHRRHLTTSQRAMIAVQANEMMAARARERMLAGKKLETTDPGLNLGQGLEQGDQSPGPNLGQGPEREGPDPGPNLGQGLATASTAPSREEVGRTADLTAKRAHVSGSTIELANKVKTEGTPELVAAVSAGKVTVSAAAQVATLPAHEQREVVREKKVKERARELREAKKPSPPPAPAPPVRPSPSASIVDPAPDEDDEREESALIPSLRPIPEPIVLGAFKDAYKKGRTPADETERLNQIFAAVRSALNAWRWIVIEWNEDRRGDMRFALDSAGPIAANLQQTVAKLEAILGVCTGRVPAPPADKQ